METHYGHVCTFENVIELFKQCQLGELPQVQRPLSDEEMQTIRPGSVFIWEETRRWDWVDDRLWSDWEISSRFRICTEMEVKHGEWAKKQDGLIKQLFRMTTYAGQHLNLMYYSQPHAGQPQPTTDPQLRHIIPLRGMYPDRKLLWWPSVMYQERQVLKRGSSYHPHRRPPHQQPLPTSVAHGSPRQTPYDRPLPPMANPIPPPPPPQQHRGVSNAAHPNTMPAYQPNSSPRMEQSRAMAEQQRIAQRALQSTPMMDLRSSHQPTLLPPLNGLRRTPPPPHHTSSQVGTPQSGGRPASPHDPLRPNPAPSQAQSIPSISHLVHATDSVSVISDNTSNSSRPGSRSPKENGDRRPKDILHEKLNTRVEDQRAIRVLDQKFAF